MRSSRGHFAVTSRSLRAYACDAPTTATLRRLAAAAVDRRAATIGGRPTVPPLVGARQAHALGRAAGRVTNEREVQVRIAAPVRDLHRHRLGTERRRGRAALRWAASD